MFEDFDLCLTVAEAVKIEGLPYEVAQILNGWADSAFKCSDAEYITLCQNALEVILGFGVGDKWSRELLLFWRKSGGDPEDRLGVFEHTPNMPSVGELGVSGKAHPKRVQRPAVPSKKTVLSGGLGSHGGSARTAVGLFGTGDPQRS